MALSAGRKTQFRDGNYATYPVAAGVKIYPGARLVISSTGFARPGRASTTDKANGVAEHLVDNTAGADGDLKVKVRFGVHNMVNSASADLITYADVGNQCYVVDDFTVAKTSNTNARITGGKIIDVDADGVWVDCGPGR